MISFAAIDLVNRGERLLDLTAHRISAQKLPSPNDIADLLKARQQVTAGLHFAHAEDDLTKKVSTCSRRVRAHHRCGT
jgi:hypothetical protein